MLDSPYTRAIFCLGEMPTEQGPCNPCFFIVNTVQERVDTTPNPSYILHTR